MTTLSNNRPMPDQPGNEQRLETRRLTRRRLARGVLLGSPVGLAAAAVTGVQPAGAAPPTQAWVLGGNTISTDGSNFIGTINSAPIIFKTGSASAPPAERVRINPGGSVSFKKALASGTPVSGTVQMDAKITATTGTAVRGASPNSSATALSAQGVQGVGTVGVQGTGEYMGVQGASLNYAVFGYTTPDTGGIGVYGRGGVGVEGRSYSGYAVYGDTDDGTAVKGESYSDGGAVKAIHGEAFGADSNGVVGEASHGASAYGVWGLSDTGYAGVFSGKALVTGTLSKGAGSFQIDHPLDPKGKYLFHSFVESPDMMNVYNGNVTTDADGVATVTLPDYFEALNRDFRYQLTVLGDFAQAVVRSKVADGRFVIATDRPGVEVSWQVTGIRKDPFANANRIPVSLAKPKDEVGTYIHPEAYGQSADKGFDHQRRVALAKNKAVRAPDPVAPPQIRHRKEPQSAE
jgi:hypothetical protein